MLSRIAKVTAASLGCIVVGLANSGCGDCAQAKVTTVTRTSGCAPKCTIPAGSVASDLPPSARPGECFAKVFVPAEFKTVSERVCVREASERVEIVPAKYEWVEERVCVKEPCKRLVEVPARYETKQVTVETGPSHTDWVVNRDCLPPGNQPTRDVFCLVKHPPTCETISVTKLVSPATVREETIPGNFETVRRQKLVESAKCRKVTIPAQFENVQKRVKVCDGRMVWKRVECKMPEALSMDSGGKWRLHNGN
jgi:hypothetical protein